MFQRLKGAIDSRIAEEQARQRASQPSISRSNSSARRPSLRANSPNKRAVRKRDDDPSPEDPSEFEPELAGDNEDIPGSSAVSRPLQRKDSIIMANEAPKVTQPSPSNGGEGDKASTVDSTLTSQEVPADVRVNLRKLDKLESRYHELLKSYRIARSRVLSIEPFENALRENTPLTSISDPAALVEYLNQVNLKSDMVLDELKRVSTERDDLKEELAEAKQKAKEAWDEVANLRKNSNTNGLGKYQDEQTEGLGSEEEPNAPSPCAEEDDPLPAPTNAKPDFTKSRTGSIANQPLLSTSQSNDEESPIVHEPQEDLFSYDTELPRLESELKDRDNEINELHVEIKILKNDLSVARESTQSMVGTLEEATRGVQALQESKDQSDAVFHEQRMSLEKTIQQLKSDLQAKEEELRGSLAESFTSDTIYKLEQQLQECQDELDIARSRATLEIEASLRVEELLLKIKNMDSKIMELQTNDKESAKRTNTLDSLVKSLRTQLSDKEQEKMRLATQIADGEKSRRTLQHRLTQAQLQIGGIEQKKNESAPLLDPPNENDETHSVEANTVVKKKNKKKKKGAKSGILQNNNSPEWLVTPSVQTSECTTASLSTQLATLQGELDQVRVLSEEKDAAIERMHEKSRREEELCEEIDSLRDDLIRVGQELVEAKDTVKELLAEKKDLLSRVRDLEEELAESHSNHASRAAGAEKKYKDLAEQFENLKFKATTLQTDLSVAQQLASSRFKDLTELRNVLQKAQPEINALKREVADSTALKEALEKKEAEIKRLDAQNEVMRIEVATLKHSISDRDSDIKTLNQRILQEETSRHKAEDMNTKTSQKLQLLEIEKRQGTEALDKISRDLAKSREDLAGSRVRLDELEQQVSQVSRANDVLQEEVELKVAQYASVQNLMASMRDQTAEMAMQMKEARDRCERLDEEVTEAHKLLSERSREAETMRRLLADVEARADLRTREMKERIDTAIEERDRAEDEASTAGRKKARELEDLRNRLRETERSLKRADEDKEELEVAQRDWKRRREELEQNSEQFTKEVDEFRKAMVELRDALDESERQVRELEKEKGEMRRSIEDTQHRLEKLQKVNKSMADEMRTIQSAKNKVIDSETLSSSSSLDSTPSRARLVSPAPKNSAGSGGMTDETKGHFSSPMDFVYLKNVLLQFLEQKDKKHQVQLIPVLGMLLHFDRKDEQRWMSTITAK